MQYKTTVPKVQKEMTFKEIEDILNNLKEATLVNMVLSKKRLWINREDLCGIKIMIDEIT